MLFALCIAQGTVFLVVLVLTRISVPFWDMLSFVDDYMTHRQTGNFLAYLLLPDNEHYSVWSRLLTIVDIELFDGSGPSFQLFGLSCLLAGLMVFCFEIRHSCLPAPLRRDMLALTCMLFLTVPAAVDCAVPMNGGYVQATGFVIISLVLLDGRGEEGRHASARRATAVIAAMAASFGNAVGLLAWPILLWSAWRGRLGWAWHGGIAGFGAGFVAIYLVHLVAGAATSGDGFIEPGHMLKVVDYALAYVGLPWTRAPILAAAGRLVGGLLLAGGVTALIRYGGGTSLPTRLERICTGLIAFSMGTVALAALGRVDQAANVVVPVRYAVLLAPMHVGLLGLVLHVTAVKPYRARARASALILAALLLVQQIPAAYAAVWASRTITDTVQQFLAGERDERMQSIVFPELTKAERIFARIRQRELYQWLLSATVSRNLRLTDRTVRSAR